MNTFINNEALNAAGPPQGVSASSEGSAAHEVASVGVILLAEPRGFCAGVDRAIEIVERALQKFGRPIYVRHEIVHNTYVVNDLKNRGAIFIEELDEVPPGATLVFSAHGVSQAIQKEATRRGFRIFDATCPLVSKVHVEVAKLHKEGFEFIMIGHKGHPEVEGTMGQLDDGSIHLVEDVADVARIAPRQTAKLALVTQTTLSVDDAAEISAAVMARFDACWLGRVLWCTRRLGFGLVQVANWWCVSFAATRLGLLDLPIGASSRTRLESDQHQTTNDIDRESGGAGRIYSSSSSSVERTSSCHSCLTNPISLRKSMKDAISPKTGVSGSASRMAGSRQSSQGRAAA